MAAPKCSTSPITALIGLVFAGSFVWLLVEMIARVVLALGRSLRLN